MIEQNICEAGCLHAIEVNTWSVSFALSRTRQLASDQLIHRFLGHEPDSNYSSNNTSRKVIKLAINSFNSLITCKGVSVIYVGEKVVTFCRIMKFDAF